MTKTMRNVAAAFFMAMLLCLTLVGCQQEQPKNDTAEKPATNSVVDAYGRTVELPEQVKSAATVGSAARFVVYAGAQDKLIAVTEMETNASPARPYTMVHKELFANLPTTSNGNHLMETSVNAEELLRLSPDVIISSRSAAECDELQNSIGIPVVGISYQDQLFSEDVYTSIEVVGKTLGTQDHATEVVEKMKGWADDLDGRTLGISDSDKPTCYVGAVNYKGAKSFAGTYAHYAPLDAVNAVNVADDLGQEASVEVDLEQISVWDPDYMFLNTGNMNLMEQDYAENTAYFNNLTAFKENHLYSQPSFNFNGTNVETGICDAYFIGMTIYPEEFADVSPEWIYDEIFETMLGAPYYETMKASGLDFTQVSFA